MYRIQHRKQHLITFIFHSNVLEKSAFNDKSTANTKITTIGTSNLAVSRTKLPFKARLFRLSNSIHKWAGLVLALQILFWIGGGLIMSAIPIDKVHGDHLASSHSHEVPTNSQYTFSLDKLLQEISKETDTTVRSIRLDSRENEPVYIIRTKGKTQLFDAKTGSEMPPLLETNIKQLAQSYYLGEGEVLSIKKLKEPPHEASRARGENWQVTFSDTWNTTLYIAPLTGKLLNVRSDIWRLFDIVWMLHIMDYDTRDNINNPILISFAAAAFIFTLSGIVLLFRTFTPKRRIATK